MGIRKIGKGLWAQKVAGNSAVQLERKKKTILGSRFLIPNFWWSSRIHGIKILHSCASDRDVAHKCYF